MLKKPTQQKEWIQQTYTAPKTIDKRLKMSYAMGKQLRKEKAQKSRLFLENMRKKS